MNARIYVSLQALASATAAMALIFPVQPANADVLTVVAQGRIDPVCEITVGTPLPSVDFATTGFVRGTALINCNTGFSMKAMSANGAVKNAASASRGFTNTLNYTLSLGLGLGSSLLYAKCKSALLLAGQSACSLSPGGQGLNSEGDPAINRTATLTFSWSTPAKPRLVAGSYQDTITISIAAAP